MEEVNYLYGSVPQGQKRSLKVCERNWKEPGDYLYSSAGNYTGLKGLIEVDYW